MDIRTIFEKMVYAWYMVAVLQYVVLILQIKGSNASFTISRLKDQGSKWVIDIQPLLFIVVYNAAILLVYIITKVRNVLLIGTPLGGVLFYLSLAGDISYIMFPRDEAEKSFLDTMIIRNMIYTAILSMIESFGSQSMHLKNFSDCSQVYSLIEIVLLCFFMYSLVYFFVVSIHVIMGSMKWDYNNKLEQKLTRLREENENIKVNMIDFDLLINRRFNEMSFICRAVLFIPAGFYLMLYVIYNYIKQVFRNVRLLFETMMLQWINRQKGTLQYKNLVIYVKKTRHFSIILTLCIVYVRLGIRLSRELFMGFRQL